MFLCQKKTNEGRVDIIIHIPFYMVSSISNVSRIRSAEDGGLLPPPPKLQICLGVVADVEVEELKVPDPRWAGNGGLGLDQSLPCQIVLRRYGGKLVTGCGGWRGKG